MVSLPFSDHCQPLVNDSQELQELLTSLTQKVEQEKLKYMELRPRDENKDYPLGFRKYSEYWQHALDLSPDLNELFTSLHQNSMQRKIRRAEREGLAYTEGRSRLLLGDFYRLMLMTRRRHELPPQPLAWFQNLVDSLGEKLKIRVASKDGRAVAALLTLSFKNTVVYKYGCSDAKFHNLGGMPLLLWKTIEDAKKEGAQELDLGRTDRENTGLTTFKERLGAIRSASTYLRFPPSRCGGTNINWKMQMAKRFFSNMPDCILVAVGKLLYPHSG
jgi:lipid II:glycine glycyltransferase (peptidoglycan interpeptide bridge formation enzyme)